MEKPEGYPEVGPHQDHQHQAMASGWAWPTSKNDMSLFESGVMGNYYGHHQYNHQDHDDYNDYYSFEEGEESNKLGKLLNPRLLALVEFFRELYFRRRELFTELFPNRHVQFHDNLKNSAMKLWRVKSGNNPARFETMQRSLSLGSPRRDEWIKVRTINTGGSGGDPKGLGGSTGQAGGSK